MDAHKLRDNAAIVVEVENSITLEPSDKKKFAVRLGAFLAQGPLKNLSALLALELKDVKRVPISDEFGIDGEIYVKNKPEEVKRPPWAGYLDKLHGDKVDGLETASSSAVLIMRVDDEHVIIYSFGYGRYMLNDEYLTSDFGIKTALNTLNHETLRAVDLFSLEQEPVQKRAQASKNANINDFGVDVTKDVLRAVTGEPISGIEWSTISGGGNQYSFTAWIDDYSDLSNVAQKLIEKYSLTDYQKRFRWVDNIQRIRNAAAIAELNDKLLSKITTADTESITLSLPGTQDWSDLFGFSYTNARGKMYPSPEIADYYMCNDPKTLTIERLRSHKLHCIRIDGEDTQLSIYDCLYFECMHDGKLHILFSRNWFTVDQDYVKRVNTALQAVELSEIKFPKVKTTEKTKKTKKSSDKTSDKETEKNLSLETEGDYNERIAKEMGLILLDKKLVRADSTTSPIEVCDLLGKNDSCNERNFIHAKHRKGYSSGLSHLFAQGRVSAELLLSDQQFRKNARKLLKGPNKSLIPEAALDPKNCRITFLVLGTSSSSVRDDLPFFSKVNLLAAHRSLTERQFSVSIAGAELDAD